MTEQTEVDLLAHVPSETLTLAPAAGAGIGKMLADALLADPDFLQAMKDAALGGLRATRSFWTKQSGIVTEPDHRIQVQTVAMLLAHMEGEPIKRIIHQHLGEGKDIDPLAALRDSPALLAAVEREVEKAKWRDRHRKPKVVEAVEIEVPDSGGSPQSR